MKRRILVSILIIIAMLFVANYSNATLYNYYKPDPVIFMDKSHIRVPKGGSYTVKIDGVKGKVKFTPKNCKIDKEGEQTIDGDDYTINATDCSGMFAEILAEPIDIYTTTSSEPEKITKNTEVSVKVGGEEELNPYYRKNNNTSNSSSTSTSSNTVNSAESNITTSSTSTNSVSNSTSDTKNTVNTEDDEENEDEDEDYDDDEYTPSVTNSEVTNTDAKSNEKSTSNKTIVISAIVIIIAVCVIVCLALKKKNKK